MNIIQDLMQIEASMLSLSLSLSLCSYLDCLHK